MKKSVFFILTFLLMTSICPVVNTVHAADPVELKAITFVPKNHPIMDPTAFEWIKRINEGLKGKVHIKYLGGPEIIPSREQIEAVRKNMVQIAFIAIAYYGALLPEGSANLLVRYSLPEQRKYGFYDYLVKKHENIGIRYLGAYLSGNFWMWVQDPIKTPGDLKGKKMRSMFLYDRFLKDLGTVPVNVPPAETFTALERGVVDGFCFPLLGPRVKGFTKSTKYIIGQSFYAMDAVMIMNLDAWNKLPKSVQDKILEITADYEPDMVAMCEESEKKEWEELNKAGIKKIVFSPEDAKKFEETAYKAKWNELAEKLPPETIKELKKLTGN